MYRSLPEHCLLIPSIYICLCTHRQLFVDSMDLTYTVFMQMTYELKTRQG